MAAVAKIIPHGLRGWCARAALALLLCSGLPGALSAADYVLPTQPGPFNLQPGDTLTVASGNYTASINNIPSNATVFVNAGATLTQSNVNLSGSLVVRANGTATLGGANLGTGWSMVVEGALTLSGSMNMNGAGQLGVQARKARRPQERLVARSKRGSKNRAKKVKRLAVLREREADARRTHVHTASKHFVEAVVAKGHKAMAIEDTDVAGLMIKTISAFHLDGSRTELGGSPKRPDGSREGLSTIPPWETRSGQRALKRSLADASIGRLIICTVAKAERAGLGVVKVAAHGTTQTCARCGTKSPTKVTLQDRVFACACGWRCDRDVNAALNVLRRGRGKLDAKPSAQAPWATPTGHPALEALALKAHGSSAVANSTAIHVHPSYGKMGGAGTAVIRKTSAARQTGA